MLVVHGREARQAAHNLALEEVLVRCADRDVFMLWRDEPAVVVGRNQNALREIDRRYCERENIAVVRRLSGGGAVYHDGGNLCFTYISLTPGDRFGDHSFYTQAVIGALRRLGVPAQHEGRNDISVQGRKISGNAQYVLDGRLCHHGTLLFDVDMAALGRALRPEAGKFLGKGIDSVAARVANLKQYLPDYDVQSFGDALMRDILAHVADTCPWEIPNAVLREADKITRYRDPAWTYGQNPPYTYRNMARFPGGGVEVLLAVDGGRICDAKIFGDFLSLQEISPLEKALIGNAHDVAALREAVRPAFEGRVLGGIALEEFLTLL